MALLRRFIAATDDLSKPGQQHESRGPLSTRNRQFPFQPSQRHEGPMSSIGVVVRADEDVEALGHDWVPVPLGPRLVVESMVAELMSGAKHLMLTANVEGPDESRDPRAITFSGVWGE